MQPQARCVGLLTAAALLAAGCSDAPTERTVLEVAGSTMGTSYDVKVVAPAPGLSVETLQPAVQGTLDGVEQSMSTYIPQSELSRFNAYHGGDWFPVSAELCALVEEALAISGLSGGAFDVTVGPLVNLWGFGPGAAVVVPPAEADIAAALATTGYAKLHTDCSQPALRKDDDRLYVDLSAIAKGYAADVVAARLVDLGAADYLVEVGGELRVSGSNASGSDWSIAVETPRAAGRSVHSIMSLTDKGIATSGDYRNFFEYEGRIYSHTIDPRTGYPVAHDAASVTVVAESAAQADALATALLVLGPDAGLQFAESQGLAAYFLMRDADSFAAHATPKFTTEVASQ